MTFITKQSVAFNILNNIQEDSTAELLEKGRQAVVGEVREWKGGKFRKTATGWEPVKEGGGEKQKETGEKTSGISVGQSLRVPANLTSDPIKKQGETGKVTSVQEDIVTIEFSDGKSGKYDKSIWDGSKETEDSKNNVSPQVKRVMDSLTTVNSKYSDPQKVTVSSTPKGNWRVYYDGKETGITLGGNQISEDTIRDNQWEHHDEEESKEPEKETNENLIFGDLNLNDSFMIVVSGGSMGGSKSGYLPQFNGTVYKTSNDEEKIKETAKRNNANLTPGEKGYYKIKYSVKPITESVRKYVLKEWSKQ